MDKLYNHLKSLPKEILEYFILNLMKDGKISFADIATLHAKYLELLKKGETERLMHLRSEVINLWVSTKKDLPSKLVALIREGKANGWVNITDEQIEKSKWNK